MRIITISREFGSGGRELGKRLAETLGVPCYDQEIIEMIAEKRNWIKTMLLMFPKRMFGYCTHLPSANISSPRIISDISLYRFLQSRKS